MKKAQVVGGVVTNIILVDPDSIPDWCAAWPDANDDTVIGDVFYMGAFGAMAPPAPTQDDVNNERNRRMSGTFVFNGVRYDCDQKSLARITGAATLAGFAIASGTAPFDLFWHGGETPFTWISNDNSMIEMDAVTTFSFGREAAHNESAHIFAGRALKDMEPIPADYADDKYWP